MQRCCTCMHTYPHPHKLYRSSLGCKPSPDTPHPAGTAQGASTHARSWAWLVGAEGKGAGGVSLFVPPVPPQSQPRAAIKEAIFSLQHLNLILHLKARGD